MAVELATAYVNIVPSTQGLGSAITRDLTTGTAATATATAGKTAGVNYAAAFAVASGAALAGGLFLKGAYDAASEAEQAVGGVSAIFKENADVVNQWAASADRDLGLTETAYQNSATIIGAQLKNMGIPMDQVAGQTNGLLTMGADLAAQFGGSTSDAVAALSSLLRGERDPIERYGVSINEAMLSAKMAEMGLDGLTGEAERNAKIQATLALLNEQTADAQGAFAREADTAAGAAARQAAMMGNVKATLGEALLPLVTQITQFISTSVMPVLQAVAGFLAEHPAVLWAVVGAVGALAIGLGIAAAAQWVMNAALLANPVTWIIVGIVALIAALVLLIANWDAVVAWVTGVWNTAVEWIKTTFASIGEWFSTKGAEIAAFLSGLWNSIKATAEGIWNGIVSFVQSIPARILAGLAALAQLAARIGEWVQSAKDAAVEKFNSLVDWVKGVPQMILSALGNVGTLLYSAGKAILTSLWDGMKAIWGNITSWVSGIGDWIAAHKGPRSYDLRLLQPAGGWIMDGLQKGLADGIPGLRDTLGDVSATVSAAQFQASAQSVTAMTQSQQGMALARAMHGTQIEITGAGRFTDTMSARIVTTRSRMAGVH